MLLRGPGRPLCEAMNVELGLQWGPQDVRGARAVGYQPRRAVTRSGAMLRDRSGLEVSQAGRWGPLSPLT